MINKGIVIQTGKFRTLIGFDALQDGEVKKMQKMDGLTGWPSGKG